MILGVVPARSSRKKKEGLALATLCFFLSPAWEPCPPAGPSREGRDGKAQGSYCCWQMCYLDWPNALAVRGIAGSAQCRETSRHCDGLFCGACPSSLMCSRSPLPCSGTVHMPNLTTAANSHCLYGKQQASNPLLFSFCLNMTNVKEKMRNYFGLKLRTNNGKCQAMGSFKAIILHYTILKSIAVLPQERGIATFPKAPGEASAPQNPRQPV